MEKGRKDFCGRGALRWGVLLAAALAAGCGGVKQAAKDTFLRPERVDPPFPQTYQFADLPAPAAYTLDPNDSFSYAYGNVRVAGISYRGDGRAVEAADFFKTELPRNGWTFQGETLIGRTNHLVFAKEHDRCDVAIHDDLHETRIRVNVEYQ